MLLYWSHSRKVLSLYLCSSLLPQKTDSPKMTMAMGRHNSHTGKPTNSQIQNNDICGVWPSFTRPFRIYRYIDGHITNVQLFGIHQFQEAAERERALTQTLEASTVLFSVIIRKVKRVFCKLHLSLSAQISSIITARVLKFVVKDLQYHIKLMFI